MKILISAYACEPERGSEPGTGWHWSFVAARTHDVLVLTRANNRGRIEAALAEHTGPAPRFAYVDLPRWASFWKRGGRGIRTYYILWQVLAGRAARRLHRVESFDLVHHVTFGNMWLPALACRAHAPFVLGPVGGGQHVPLPLLPSLGMTGIAKELLQRFARRASGFTPQVRVGWRRAAVIVVQDEHTGDSLPRRYREKIVLRPPAVVPDTLVLTEPFVTQPPLVAAVVGRINRFKGQELAVRALALAPGWRLLVVGRGPDAGRIRSLTEQLGLADRIDFLPWLDQAELWQRLGACRALIVPSLKEGGAPFVIAEGQTLGVPVIALDIAGSRAYRHTVGAELDLVPTTSRREAIEGIAAALRRQEQRPRKRPTADFSLDAVARDLKWIYRKALEPRVARGQETHA